MKTLAATFASFALMASASAETQQPDVADCAGWPNAFSAVPVAEGVFDARQR